MNKEFLQEIIREAFDAVPFNYMWDNSTKKRDSKLIQLAIDSELNQDFIDELKNDYYTEYSQEWEEANQADDRNDERKIDKLNN
jgi:hypothetical protein